MDGGLNATHVYVLSCGFKFGLQPDRYTSSRECYGYRRLRDTDDYLSPRDDHQRGLYPFTDKDLYGYGRLWQHGHLHAGVKLDGGYSATHVYILPSGL